jgi:hypothetical protein
MRQIKSILCVALAALTILGSSNSLQAQEEGPIKLTLRPQAESKPALKYQLLPGFMDQIPGNAAVYYGKVMAEQQTFFDFKNRALWDKIEDVWQEMPLGELKKETINFPKLSIAFLEQGARCKYCDWQLPIREVPFYEIPLPDIQQSRTFARILAVKARREIAEGKMDEAIKTFQTTYALGRNVAEGETLINGLIGIAMCGIIFPQVTEFVQQPDAPNLYWALTALPHPMVDMRKALAVEAHAIELSFPELRDLENSRRSPEEWRELVHDAAIKLFEIGNNPQSPRQPVPPEKLDDLCQQVHAAAKRELIVRGLSREAVDAMSIHQVALLNTLATYRDLLDDGIKAYSLPYPEAIARIDAAAARAADIEQRSESILPIAPEIFPALRATRGAVARNDRHFAVLRVIEALRLYGASHVGKLPAKLSDITEVPIPHDPVTGQPFSYRLEGNTAFLESPGVKDPARPVLRSPLSFEIKMANPYLAPR